MAKNLPKLPELPTSVNELIADRAIRHALYLERYKTQVVNDILTEFNNSLEPALVAKIEKSLHRMTGTSKHLQALFKYNGELVREEYIAMEAKLYGQLRDFAKVESAWLIQTMQNVMPIAYDFVAPSAVMLKSLVTTQPMEGALVKEWFGKLSRDTAFNVNKAIQMGMVEGEGIEKIVRRIAGTRAEKYGDALLEASRREIQTIVRTATGNVSNAARNETYAANSDVVKGVEIIATLDSGTCLKCGNLDGKQFPLDSGPRPTFHFKCKCGTVPVLKSWKELGIPLKELPPGTRASSALTKTEKKRIRKLPKEEQQKIKSKLTGQVPATQKYPDWLSKQTKAFQADAFGGGPAGMQRAEYFRSGKLKLNEFVDRRDRPLTLKKLEELVKKGN